MNSRNCECFYFNEHALCGNCSLRCGGKRFEKLHVVELFYNSTLKITKTSTQNLTRCKIDDSKYFLLKRKFASNLLSPKCTKKCKFQRSYKVKLFKTWHFEGNCFLCFFFCKTYFENHCVVKFVFQKFTRCKFFDFKHVFYPVFPVL